MNYAENPFFQQWIAREVQSHSRRKRPLTFAGSRTDACQEGFGGNFEAKNLALALDSERATANLMLLLRKPP